MKNKLNIDLSHSIKKISIFSKRLVTSNLMGSYKSKIRGKGLEFSNFRDYNFADDSSLIDWKVSIRVNKPVIKEFVEERNLKVFLLIDISSSMVFGSTKKLKNEYITELVSTLSYAILNIGDSLGYAFFADKLINFTQPSNNKKLFYTLSRSLINPELYGGYHDLEKALLKINKILKKNTVLIIVSDFISLKGDWQEALKRTAYKFDTIIFMIKDPRDRELPEESSMILLSHPYLNKQIILDPTPENREKYKEYVLRQEKEIQEIFLKLRIPLLQLTTDSPFLIPLITFFKKREKW